MSVRTSIFALAAVAALDTTALAPTTASAFGGHGGGNNFGGGNHFGGAGDVRFGAAQSGHDSRDPACLKVAERDAL